jgi:hypothetical protein
MYVYASAHTKGQAQVMGNKMSRGIIRGIFNTIEIITTWLFLIF